MKQVLVIGVLAIVLGMAGGDEKPSTPAASDNQAAQVAFDQKIAPLLGKYCINCHGEKKQSGGLSLAKYKDLTAILNDRKVWEDVKDHVHEREMPPKGKPQPTDAERDLLTGWIDARIASLNCGATRDSGRPTIRRLNRSEYNNTVHDLLGVNLKPADDFPSDDIGYGFDNIGDVLSLPPTLLERYLAAADKLVDAAIVTEKPILSNKDVFRPQNIRASFELTRPLPTTKLILSSESSAFVAFDFLNEGDYIIRVRVFGEPIDNVYPLMAFQLEQKSLETIVVYALEGNSKVYEFRTHVKAGKREAGVAFLNPVVDADTRMPSTLNIERLEIEGPFNPVPPPPPESYRKIMIAKPTLGDRGTRGPGDKGTGEQGDREAAAGVILTAFMKKAYRRPVSQAEVGRVLKIFRLAQEHGEPFEAGIRLALKAVLVSPHFLFRIETDPTVGNMKPHLVNEFELASRLSYFLWSTMPDDELFALAEKGKLRENLDAQVRRMIKDPRSHGLVENFGGQWLNLRILQTAAPDKTTYPGWSDELRDAMIQETEMFIEYILREDKSVMEFLDSDVTFLNSRLARHYGITGVQGREFRKVKLPDKNRGGVLTQASILTLTSNPTRTSPVKRGKWILENILGTPPPPPAADVPPLDENKKASDTASLRKRMEEHRKNPSCATCHQKMDPLGFGLENFDGIGGWRTQDGKFRIDPSGTLPGGETFNSPAQLRQVLLGKGDLFRHALAEKLLTFAIGRGTEYYDNCAIDEMVTALKADKDRFSALILAVVHSDPFQKRRR